MAFVHLEQYLVDVGNFVGYGTMPVASYVQLKLVRSLMNNQRRSRLSSRKSFDQSAVFQAIEATPFFAKEWYSWPTYSPMPLEAERPVLRMPPTAIHWRGRTANIW